MEHDQASSARGRCCNLRLRPVALLPRICGEAEKTPIDTVDIWISAIIYSFASSQFSRNTSQEGFGRTSTSTETTVKSTSFLSKAVREHQQVLRRGHDDNTPGILNKTLACFLREPVGHDRLHPSTASPRFPTWRNNLTVARIQVSSFVPRFSGAWDTKRPSVVQVRPCGATKNSNQEQRECTLYHSIM